VKICIVGVPSDIKTYLSSQDNIGTISGRIREISEVERMSKEESEFLLRLGFEVLQSFEVSSEVSENFYQQLMWITDRIALELQEIGLRVSKRAVENERKIDRQVIDSEILEWLKMSMQSATVTVESHMNSKETRAGRRNQCIYALGVCDNEDFRYLDVEKIIKHEFPLSTANTKLNVSQNLSTLSKGGSPLIKKSTQTGYYRFCDPRYRMAIRSLLIKNKDERIVKKIIPK